MDDGANVDLVDVSPINSPDRLQITVDRLWGEGESHSDEETEDADDVADDLHGSPRWLPYPQRVFQRLKPSALDINLLPPFPHSPGYPSIGERTPSPPAYTPGFLDHSSKSILSPTELDNMRLYHYPPLSIYDPNELDCTHAWELHSHFSASWDVEDDSDFSEPSDEPKGYITFTGNSAPISQELGLGFQRSNLSEPGAFVLDFPEDVGELVEQETDGDSGMIGHLGRPDPMPTSEIPVELSVQAPEGPQSPPLYSPSIFLPRLRKSPDDGEGFDSFPRLPFPGSDATGVPINVPMSPLALMNDGFPDDASAPFSDSVGVEIEGVLMDSDWSEESWGETICSPCSEQYLVEWEQWCGQLVEELDRDLDSWASVRENVRTGLDHC